MELVRANGNIGSTRVGKTLDVPGNQVVIDCLFVTILFNLSIEHSYRTFLSPVLPLCSLLAVACVAALVA